jgi:hypothetical protein
MRSGERGDRRLVEVRLAVERGVEQMDKHVASRGDVDLVVGRQFEMPVADGTRAHERKMARIGDLVVDLVLEEAGIVLRLAGDDRLHRVVLVGEAGSLPGGFSA